MTALQFQAELTSPQYAEIGRPASGFRHQNGKVVALCSTFGYLYWPGRAMYDGHRLRYRLSIYDYINGKPSRRLNVFDAACYSINDVAFYPSKPLLAIGTGDYDGGFMFEGDLWLWNWETGQAINLLKESSEVTQCRFVDDDLLMLSLRPLFEDEFEQVGDQAFCLSLGSIIDWLCDGAYADKQALEPSIMELNLDLTDLTLLGPSTVHFNEPPMTFAEQRPSFFAAMGEEKDYEERARIWDLLWLSDEAIALVHDHCHIEVWNTDGTKDYVQTGDGFGIQLLDTPQGPLLHVLNPGDYLVNTNGWSTLYCLKAESLERLHTFDRTVVLSVDRSGTLLCRDPGQFQSPQTRMDRVLTRDLQEIVTCDLGHYDCFNHYIRLDDGEGLYFLRGTPPSSHQKKTLCCVQEDGSVQTVMDWDGPDAHLMYSIGCWGPNDTLIRAFSIYDPHPNGGDKQIQCCNCLSGQVLWTLSLNAIVTSMVMVGQSTLAYALTDGTLGLLDMTDGTSLHEEVCTVEGIPTVVTALAARGSRLVVGTLDGRLLLYQKREE